MSEKKQEPPKINDLVVVGSSAGGIEALSVFLSSLQKDFPAPIVLAQHLDPFRPSNLHQILERRSVLPVILVEDAERLEIGKVYVVPANRHVTIRDGTVKVEGDHGNRPRPSIDLLLTSAAKVYGERLIAVVLTGYGSDGAAGAVEVKKAGGTVIIQNPATARYPSMPLSLPPTAVDHVTDIEQLGPLLYDLCKGVEIAKLPEKSQDSLQDVLNQINRLTQVDFRSYKPSTLLRRIARRMAVTHNADISNYVKYLEKHPAEAGELVMTFLIKVTEFFRDKQSFDYLKQEILPGLIERSRSAGERTLRFWSAGCATGEEPYSLAMLVADLLGAELSQWTIKIFATDLDEDAINFARRGLYPPNVLTNLPDDYRDRFFEKADHGHRISKTLRQMVIFGHQDLARGVPFPRIDLVVCRNLLIYFKPELQQQVLDLFAFSLHQGRGYLFLGKAETVRPSKSYYEQVDKRLKVYRCVSDPPPERDAQGLHSMPRAWLKAQGFENKSQHRERRIKLIEGDLPRQKTVTEIELGELRRFNELVFRFLPAGIVVIDRNYRILTVNGVARRLLAFRELAHDQDFLHTARGLPYAEVRGAIDTVFREGTTETLSELALEPIKGSGQYLSLTVAPMQIETGQVGLAVITVEEITEQLQTRQRLEAVQTEQRQLLEELSTANTLLGDLNKELQDANEQLQAANEEMMLAQEELQATNEELEATNEELQATNEELETNNEELQATNEELETTNEELTVRTTEMQDTSKLLADERARLQVMVELAPFDVMILRGPNLIIEAANSRAAGLAGGREILGLPFAEVYGGEELTELVTAAREARRQGVVKVTPSLPRNITEGAESVKRYFVYTLVPTHDSTGEVNGVAIYAEDVTEQRAREAAERREQLKLMIENAEQVALGLYDAGTAELLQASPRYLDALEGAYGRQRDQVIGHKWQELPFVTPQQEAARMFEAARSGVLQHSPEVRLKLDGNNLETVWICSLTPIRFQRAEPSRKAPPATQADLVLISAIEVTDQIRAREEQERLNNLKDQFFSLASHELRTPLVPLSGYTEMMKRLLAQPAGDPQREQKIAQVVDKFQGQIKHLERLTDDLFDMARLESGKFSLATAPLNLPEVVSVAIEEARLFSPQPPIHCKVSKNNHALSVHGDRDRLIQVIGNLLRNALKYAPQSERIDVRLGQTRGAKPQAQIEVQDYGPGIAEDEREAIFKRFYQVYTHDGPQTKTGLGLGLFIARSIIEQHGGTLSVQSKVGEGSNFVIRLPLLRTGE